MATLKVAVTLYQMQKIILLSFLLLSSTQAKAQSAQVSSYNQMVNNAQALQGKADPKIIDAISGVCEFDSGSCNGAKVIPRG